MAANPNAQNNPQNQPGPQYQAGLTNLQHYESRASFTTLLTLLGVAQSEQRHLNTDGFNTLQELVEYFELSTGYQIRKYFERINATFGSSPQGRRVYISPPIIEKLTGVIWYFAHAVYTFHSIPNLVRVTTQKATQLGRLVDEIEDNPNPKESTTKDDDDITLPKLKNASAWIDFRDKAIIKVARLRNRRYVSLEYLLDETERRVHRSNANLIEVVELDLTDRQVFKTGTVFFGKSFKTDNRRLWDLLEATLVNTTAFNHISPFERTYDGRKAWLSLKRHFEGEDYISRTKEQAMSTLSNTYYRGESRSYRFEDYINSHLNAHKKLLQIGYNGGLGMDDSTKIHHFKQNILPSAQLETALAIGRTRETGTFSEYYTFLSTEVDFMVQRKKRTTKTSGDRNVAGYEVQEDSNKKNNAKPKNKLGPVLYETCEGRKLESKSYSKQEFSRLSRNQRSVVIKLNRERKRRARESQNQGKGGNNAIHSLRSDLGSLGDAIVAGVKNVVNPSPENSEGADSNVCTPPVSNSSASANSGGVGDFIKESRKRKQSS